MLVKAQGRYLLLRRASAFRLEFVPKPVVAELLWENLLAPATDDNWGWEVLVPTAEGRRAGKREVSDDE